MNNIIDIGDGTTSVGVFYASGGIKIVKASIERQYEPLSMWFLLGCTRSRYRTILVVYIQAATGIDKFHNSRHTVTEEFAQNAIKHITKQIMDIDTKVCLDDNLNDAFWHDCTVNSSCSENIENNIGHITENDNDKKNMTDKVTSELIAESINDKTDSTSNDYSDMPPLVPGPLS